MINIDALNDDEKLAALESIHKSIAESKEIQKKKITTNVELIVKALKKIESDLKQRYDETGQLIANLKNGEDGRDGKDGKDGKNGRDGRDGPVGPRGFDGVPGRNGIDGTDGVSVTDAHIDFDGSLIISLSSGRVINVGEVVAADIAEKIKVITNGGGTSQGVLDAIASLQAQIDSIASGLEYQGTWNASTNVPTLTSSVGTAGYYYIVATAGSTNLNGVTDWQIGDWAVFNGSVWQKIDQTNLVTSVAGRTGAITLTTADIGGLGTIATQAASNVAITGGSIAGITDLAIADGGTGQSTAAAAITALTGTQTSGYYLRSNGTSASLSAISAGDVPTLNQNTTGTAAGLSATLATSSGGTGLTSFTADGVPYATSTSVLATSGLLKFQATNSALTVAATTTSNGYVGFTNSADGGTQGYIGDAKALITPGINSALAVRGEDAILFGIASTEGMRLNSIGLGIGKTAGSALDVKGTIRLSGSTSGYVGLAPAAAAGSTTYTLPSADGTANQALVTNGSGTLSWASTATGTVTSVAASVPTFLSIAGSPITSSGTLAITLSGTALPTTSGGTGLTSFTANGVVYASSTSALATGTALTFDGTNLSSTGGATFLGSPSGYGGGEVRLGPTTADTQSAISTQSTGSPQLFFDHRGTSNTGLFAWRNGSGGANELMRLTSTGLGIGTSSPAYKLDVAGSSRIGASGASTALLIGSDAATTGGLIFADATRFISGSIANNPYLFYTNNSEKMRLDSSGNLGLGVTPSAWGGVYKGIQNGQAGWMSRAGGSDSYLMANSYYDGTNFKYINSSYSTLYTQDAGTHSWFTAGIGTAGNSVSFTQAMTLTASGNFGIGTSSPAEKLVIAGGCVQVTGNLSSLNRPSSSIMDFFSGQTRFFSIGADSSTYGGFSFRTSTTTTNTERMVLDSSGNLGLAVTPSAWGFGGNLELPATNNISFQGAYGNILSNAYYDLSQSRFEYTTNGFAAHYQIGSGGQHIWLNAPSGTAGNAITFTQAMTLDASGRLGIGQTSPSYNLDVAGGVGTTARLGKLLIIDDSPFVTGANISSGTNPLAIGGTGSQPLYFFTNNTERARIDSSGNFMVGTTTIGTGNRMNVVGNNVVFSPNTAGKDTHTFSTGAVDVGTYAIKSDTTTTIYLNAGGKSYINGGNLGIGQTNPASALEIANSGSSTFNSFNGQFQRGTSDTTFNLLSISNLSTNCTVGIYCRIVATSPVTNDACVIELWAAASRQSGGAVTYTAVTPVVNKAIVGANISAGSLAWSGATLQYTTSASTNYVMYHCYFQVTAADSATISFFS